MTERRHSRYTRSKTWAALYSQHINAGYALVPYSATNNSIAVIRCKSPEETLALMQTLLEHADECAEFYAMKQLPEAAPSFLQKARHAVVLARSSDYYHYHLTDHTEFRLVICGIHDSSLHMPVWEMRTNQRYDARATAVSISSPDFDRLRRTQFGHNILVGALITGDQMATTFKNTLRPRTRRRLEKEVQDLQDKRYQGRPLSFLTDAERREIGSKISEGLRRYHDKKRLKVI